MKRYPHTATLETTREIPNESGIPTVETEQTPIIGRYEPAGQRNSVDQSAKFYCPINPDFEDRNITGHKLYYGGSWLGVSNAFNFQVHAEIWLD